MLSLSSDIGGRKWVYVISILVYAILNIVSCPELAWGKRLLMHSSRAPL